MSLNARLRIFRRRIFLPQDPQVLQKDLTSHEYQDQPPGKFCLSFIAQAEYMACLYSDGGEDKRDHTDKCHCPKDIDV